MTKNKKILLILLTALLVLIAFAGIFLAWYFNLFPQKSYTADDFNIETIKSSVDFNGNGIDDYTDIMLGARIDAENHPTYDSAYVDGGYPSDDRGVCTDVVWRAFKNAGYSLKDMVDKDISQRVDQYPNVESPDPNIDFRRVKNLKVFFDKYAVSLTIDKSEIAEWQAGDIVIFGKTNHIGIVSDKRNKHGQPYIIHNAGQPMREEDVLNKRTVVYHYRFDASKLSADDLIAWHE